jgi:chromosome segregation ATPase
MSELIQILRSTNDEIDIAAADEIERQGRYIKSLEHYEATNKAEIERLEAEIYRKDKRIEAWKKSSDEHEAAVERLRAVVDAVKFHKHMMPYSVMKALATLEGESK